MFDWFHKKLPKNTFYALLEMILHLEKARNIYTRMPDFTFQKKKKNATDYKEFGWAE